MVKGPGSSPAAAFEPPHLSQLSVGNVAFHSDKGPGGFGFGLGNVILVINVVMLWVYTLSCHSCRHIVGGRLKHFSKHPVRYWFWSQVSACVGLSRNGLKRFLFFFRFFEVTRLSFLGVSFFALNLVPPWLVALG